MKQHFYGPDGLPVAKPTRTINYHRVQKVRQE